MKRKIRLSCIGPEGKPHQKASWISSEDKDGIISPYCPICHRSLTNRWCNAGHQTVRWYSETDKSKCPKCAREFEVVGYQK